MVSSRKRGRQEMEAPEQPKEQSLVDRIRNMWEFAALSQWIFLFGSAVKLDENIDVEELEMECLKSQSSVLPEIGLALLKFVSSHRGLTPEIYDEYTRRQYVAKAPDRNPFGVEEEPTKFIDFDVITKIRVLQQLTQWAMGNPDRIRERMEEQKDTEQTAWRIEPFGWDSDDRTYFVLDDNRLYRRTDPPPPPSPAAKPKKTSKKAKAAARANKRRRISQQIESEAEPAEDEDYAENTIVEQEDDGFGGMVWECLAITLDEYNSFIASLAKSRDPNEKSMRKRIIEDVLPLLEKQEEARKRKAAQKERELLNLEKLATAKRSSRIRGRVEQQKHEEELREAEKRKQAELAMAKKEQEKWLKLEKERETRMMTREQRVKEREARRILHEEELANLSEDSRKIGSGEGRLSERHLKAEIERKKQALEELAEEDDWIFDCICGAYGQIDDGTHSIACDKCNIWQHSKCVGVSKADADRDDFHFICTTCQRRARDAERAKTHPPIKIKLNRPGSSSSAATPNTNGSPIVIKPGVVSHSEQSSLIPQPRDTTAVYDMKKSVPTLASWSTGGAHSPNTLRQKAPATSDSNGQYSSPQQNTVSGSKIAKAQAPQPNAEELATSSRSLNISLSPLAESQTKSRPPTQPKEYTFINGNDHHTHDPHAIQASHLKKAYGPKSAYSIAEVSPSVGSHDYKTSTINQNSTRPLSSHSDQRRSSFNMPSPLANTPILKPSNKQSSGVFMSGLNKPLGSPTSTILPHKSSSPRSMSSPGLQEAHQQNPHQSFNSSLPPNMNGLSPTKHSPPRSSMSIAPQSSPATLPPVASLLPNPQAQNLTPPVKPSEGDWHRSFGQPSGH